MEVKYIVPKEALRRPTPPPFSPDFSSLKEPAEAFEALSIEALTGKILQRKDLSQWQKAELLTQNLERYLALKRNLDKDQPPPEAPITTSVSAQVEQPPARHEPVEQPAAVVRKVRKRKVHVPTKRYSLRSKPKKSQTGSDWLSI